MKRTSAIRKTIKLLSALSDKKLIQAADYISFSYQKQQNDKFQNEIQKLAELSGAFDFLFADECIYTLDDIEEKY